MAVSKSTFHADLLQFYAKVEALVGLCSYELAAHMWRSFVANTPVDTGSARASWRLTKNTIDYTYVSADYVIVKHKSEKGFYERALPPPRTPPKVGKIHPGDELYVTNAVPYMQELRVGRAYKARINPQSSGWLERIVQRAELDWPDVVQRVRAGEVGDFVENPVDFGHD